MPVSFPLSWTLLDLLHRFSAKDGSAGRVDQLCNEIVHSASYFFPDIPLLFDRVGINAFVPDDNQTHKLNWPSLIVQYHISLLSAVGWSAFARIRRRGSIVDPNDLQVRSRASPGPDSSRHRLLGVRPDYSSGSLITSQQSRNIGTFQSRSSIMATPSFESLRFTFTPTAPEPEPAAVSLDINSLFDFLVVCDFDAPLFRALILAVSSRGLLDRPFGIILEGELAEQLQQIGVHPGSGGDVSIAFDDYFKDVSRCLLEPDFEEQLTTDLAADRAASVVERIASLEPFVTVPHSYEFLESLLAPLCFQETPDIALRANALYCKLQNGHSLDVQQTEVVTAEFALNFDVANNDITIVIFAPGNDGVYIVPLGAGTKSFTPSGPGFYDYCHARISTLGVLEIDSSMPSGRYIVLPAGVRKDIVHELPAFDERGQIPFERLAEHLQTLWEAGVTAVHITGAIERNVLHRLASVTDHAAPSQQSGGVAGLADLCRAARQYPMRVLVDFTPLVALQNWSRKYMTYQTTVMDGEGLFRTGRVVGSDSMLMNMRSYKFWDLLSSEMVQLCERAGVSGFYLGNADTWDYVYPRNMQELLRADPDGEPHYFKQMIIEGSIVDDSASSIGIRTRGAKVSPFLQKLMRRVWRQKADAFVWMSCPDEAAKFVIESGIVPQTASFGRAMAETISRSLQAHELSSLTAGKDLSEFFAKRSARVPKGSLFLSSFGGLLDGAFNTSLEGINLALDCLVYLSDVPLINGVLPGALHVPTAYDVQLAPRATISKWSPHMRFTELLRIRAAMRLHFQWVLTGDLTVLPVSYDSEPCNGVLAVARTCPGTGKSAFISISFFADNLIFEVPLNQLAIVKTAPADCVIGVQEMLVRGSKPTFYGIKEVNSDVSGAFLDTRKFESHAYEVIMVAPPIPQHYQRNLMENVAQRMENAMEFHTLSVLARNQFFTQLIRFVDKTPTDEELLQFVTQFPSSPSIDMVSHILRAMFFVSCHKIDPSSGRLVLVRDDDEVEAREGKLLLILKALKSHTVEFVSRFGLDLIDANKQGPIMFIAPELGPFSKVGGLSVMVWELAKELVQLGLDIHCVSPYYNVNPKGETGYLAQYGIEHKFNVDIYTPEQNTIGVHFGVVDDVKCWFIHNFSFFSAPYQTGSTSFRLKTMVILARAPLELCCQIRFFPSVIVTNDWMTGLVAAYGKHMFGDAFVTTKFLHIFHNLGVGYAGKIWPNDGNPWALADIHQLPHEFIVDQFDRSLDPSLSALLCTDQWATVSKKYRDELLETSPYNYFLKQRFPQPFAYSNGIRLQERLAALRKLGMNHAEAKRAVQQKFFGEVDDGKCLFLFIGRIVEQKGVFLIIDSFEELHRRYEGRMQFIVGGQAASDDRTYGLPCTQKMWDLKQRFPKNFWADPSSFFVDGVLCCQAADCMLIPSLFEPSGIVQQEAFASGCPVLAFRTGGLADTVFEYDPQKQTGNGFLFWAHRHRDYVRAMERAFATLCDKEQYAVLRKNAFASVLSTEKVAREWAREFARLFQRFYEPDQPHKEFVVHLPDWVHE